VASAEMPRAATTIATGRAVVVPAIPTSGAIAAPTENWKVPSSADALPAKLG